MKDHTPRQAIANIDEPYRIGDLLTHSNLMRTNENYWAPMIEGPEGMVNVAFPMNQKGGA
jgi:hypothetical protein